MTINAEPLDTTPSVGWPYGWGLPSSPDTQAVHLLVYEQCYGNATPWIVCEEAEWFPAEREWSSCSSQGTPHEFRFDMRHAGKRYDYLAPKPTTPEETAALEALTWADFGARDAGV